MTQLRIKELLKKRGLTQQELADKLGISRVGLNKAITGNTTINTLEKIADALNVPISELFATSSQSFVCPECGAELKLQITKA